MNGPGFTSEIAKEYDKWKEPPEDVETTEEEIQDAEDKYQEDLCDRIKSGDFI